MATAFAVLAGNIGLKNPSEAAFLQSVAFVLLKSAINSHDSLVTDQNSGKDLTQNQTTNVEFKKSSLPTPGERRELSPPTSPKSAPKCSTPSRESPPKFRSPTSNNTSDTSSIRDHPLQSDSLISEISLNSSYAPAYKKRKIRQKVEAVMGSVEAECLKQGEKLGDLIAHSCLFERKTKFDGREIISTVFSKLRGNVGFVTHLINLSPRGCGFSEYT